LIGGTSVLVGLKVLVEVLVKLRVAVLVTVWVLVFVAVALRVLVRVFVGVLVIDAVGVKTLGFVEPLAATSTLNPCDRTKQIANKISNLFTISYSLYM
jgi:hypothetical protein